MTKIKLSLENLRVESFATAAGERRQGTVLGNAKTVDTCDMWGCGSAFDTCDEAGCGSAIDACPSSPHAATLPCNGCVDTDLC